MMKDLARLKHFVIDVDGVLTDGSFYYTTEGKIMKKFGPDDNDALALLKNYLIIHAISGDKRGFAITKKRVLDDMGLRLDYVSTSKRIEWIKQNYEPKDTIYMGDGIFDSLVFKQVGFSIAPANAFYKTKLTADFVTNTKGGSGAVAEACAYIIENVLKLPFDTELIKFISK